MCLNLPGMTAETGGGKFGGGLIIGGGILTPGFGGEKAKKKINSLLP